jgi:hypothetical protein
MVTDRSGSTPNLPVPPANSFEALDGASLTTRALAHWPRLDRALLNRAHGDPRKIARVITRRTVLPVEAIVAILVREEPGDANQLLDSDLDLVGAGDAEVAELAGD